jgi:uncharacterized repeat protein (TIGR01451 family)
MKEKTQKNFITQSVWAVGIIVFMVFAAAPPAWAPPESDLAITKSDSPDPVTVNSNLVYTLVVNNNGPLDETGVVVTDNLPVSVNYVSNTCGASNGGGTVTWNVGALANGASASCDITVTPTVVGQITNNASVTGIAIDLNLENNTYSESTTVEPEVASLTIIKEADPEDGTDFAFTTNALPTGNFLDKWGSAGSGDGEFNRPMDVVLDAAGNVYVVDERNHRIQKVNSSGTFQLKWGSSGTAENQFSYPQSIALDADGNFYVADGYNHRIQKFNSSGTFLRTWGWGVDSGAAAFEICTSGCQKGIDGSGDGQFDWPDSIALDEDGNVYVAGPSNERIQKFDSSGTFLRTWGWGVDSGAAAFEICTSGCQAGSVGGGDGQFDTLRGVATDAAGNVYAADSDNQRVQKFNSSGTFLRAWGWGVDSGAAAFEICTGGCQAGITGNGDGQFDEVNKVEVDAAGNVYVSDDGNHNIQKFDSSGNFLAKWGGYGTSDGQFISPSGMAVDAGGNVYVADRGNDRIQIFGNNVFSLDDANPDDGDGIIQSITFDDLSTGIYTVSEVNLLDGWMPTAITCDGGRPRVDGESVTVNLLADDNVTCTFTNALFTPPCNCSTKEPAFPTCPDGYYQIDTYEDRLRATTAPNSLTYSFHLYCDADLIVDGFAQEGHPENPNCTLLGGSDPQCTEYQDYENFEVDLDGATFGNYTDYVGTPDVENAWFTAGPWTTVALEGDHDLTFTHSEDGSTGVQSVAYKISFCAQCIDCADADFDGVCDQDDNCPDIANGPGSGTCTPDTDNPGVNCTSLLDCISSCTATGDCSMDQEDTDEDGIGDVCDECPDDPNNDIDNDGVCGDSDNCPDTDNPGQADADQDGIGDECDNCPETFNGPTGGSCYNYFTHEVWGNCLDHGSCQENSGEWYKWCDTAQNDQDGDGVGDVCDNCPNNSNDDQTDTDNDGIGDECDDCSADCCLDGGDADCDDSEDCTDDSCDPLLGCVNTPRLNGTTCDDLDACTSGDTCQDGKCIPNEVLLCAATFCNEGSCDPATGLCEFTPVLDGTPCEDDDACTENDTCSGGVCVGGGAPDCDDGLPCTNDVCQGDTCQHSVAADTCLINNECYNASDLNPNNDCEECDPTQVIDDWTCVESGTLCFYNTPNNASCTDCICYPF